MDLLLDRNVLVNDMVFVNGACPVTSDTVDEVVQRLYIRLRTFFAEWFLNIGYGVPWLERILGHKTPKSSVDMILQDQIKAETGVREVLEFSSTLDVLTRVYSCKFRVRIITGEVSDFITI